MEPEHFSTLATSIALVWATGATFGLLLQRRFLFWPSLIYAMTSITVLVAVVWLNSALTLGRNAVVHIVDQLVARDPHHLCSAALGICIGFGPALFPWLNRSDPPHNKWCRRLLEVASLISVVCMLVCVFLFALQDELKSYLSVGGASSLRFMPAGYSAPSSLNIDEFQTCSFNPVQIAIGPNGGLYATGYTGMAFEDGVVAQISTDPKTGIRQERIIARNLGRPNGLAFHNGDLYVSRSGQYARTESGMLVGINTGAVTLLRDLDGDGQIDFYQDVLADLPGSQGPELLHQNNGIAFGRDGSLLVTVGAHTDRTPTSSAFEGTILRSRPDGSDVEVFAQGLRNPFDITIGPDGELFCTDNDTSRHNGDEVNHIVQDGHYGFPYADGRSTHPEGTIAPLLVSRFSTYQGLTYCASTKLPRSFHGLYVVTFSTGEIHRVRLDQCGDTYRAQAEFFACIPGALDITVDADGVFYVSCFYSKKIYRLCHRQLADK